MLSSSQQEAAARVVDALPPPSLGVLVHLPTQVTVNFLIREAAEGVLLPLLRVPWNNPFALSEQDHRTSEGCYSGRVFLVEINSTEDHDDFHGW